MSAGHQWRPPQIVRPIAIGIVRRGADLLLMAVRDDTGAITGWRPLGGTIEFGERAEEALAREFLEELGCAIEPPRQLGVIENLFSHEGVPGHEIVFVFEVELADPAAYRASRFDYQAGPIRGEAHWIAIAEFAANRQPLFPNGLLQQVLRK